MKFWDTSALIAITIDEVHQQFAIDTLESDDHMAVWWGSSIEYVSAVSRRERDGSLAEHEVTQHLDVLEEFAQTWFEVQPSQALKSLAHRLLRVHPLRAADSLQLAAAIVSAEGDPATLDFVGFDERLNRAASREGFKVLTH